MALPVRGESIPPRVDLKGQNEPAQQGAANPETQGPSDLIFDDARTLKNLIVQGNDQEITVILLRYGIDPTKVSDTTFLSQVSYFNGKPPTKKEKKFTPTVPPSTPPLVTPHGAPLSGLLSPESVANALGTLIATRFKQDAELLAIRHLAARMVNLDRDQHGRPLSAALPKTMAYLRTLEQKSKPGDPIRIRPIQINDWTVIQSSIKADMTALPDNGPNFFDALYGDPGITLARYLTWLASNTAAEVLKNGRNTQQVFDATLDASAAFTRKYASLSEPPEVSDFKVGLKAFAVLSHMLLADRGGGAIWHSADELRQLIQPCSASRCDGLYLLLGLSYARDRDLYTEIDKWLAVNHPMLIVPADPTAPSPAFEHLRTLMGNIGDLTAALQKVARDVRNLPKPVITNMAQAKPLLSDFHSVFSAAIDGVQAFVEGPLPPGAACQKADKFCAAILADRSSLDNASTNLSAIVDLTGDLQTRQYPAAMGEIIVYIDNHNKSSVLSAFLQDNGTFIAAVASAKSPNDLNIALENYALPAGSYIQLQQRAYSVTLNGFFGAAVSAETLTGSLAGANTSRTRARLGLAAPVGIAFNFGRVNEQVASSGSFFEPGAWSVFVPILDVGAVASWRLGSGGGNVPAITWQNIVSPGIYAVWSQRDSPFSVLLGGQYGPELRKISNGNATIEKAAFQFPCIEFTFNIPIFNLYQSAPSGAD